MYRIKFLIQPQIDFFLGLDPDPDPKPNETQTKLSKLYYSLPDLYQKFISGNQMYTHIYNLNRTFKIFFVYYSYSYYTLYKRKTKSSNIFDYI